MATDTHGWATNFYFTVVFQSKWDMFRCSFSEVSGLDIQIKLDEKRNYTERWAFLPREITHGNITLKRPVTSTNKKEPFSVWLSKCLKQDSVGKIVPYDMIIKLLDENGEPLAGWMCTHAFPISWTLSSLDSQKSELVTETVVVAYNRLERITQSK